MIGWMDGSMDELIDGWMDGVMFWLDGWMVWLDVWLDDFVGFMD